MKLKVKTSKIILVLSLMLLSQSSFSKGYENSSGSSVNSGMHVAQKDRNGGMGIRGYKKSEAAKDMEISSRIRADIMNDKTLSPNANNIKITTTEGKVTLKGLVRSEDEKNSLLKHAQAVVGELNVSNEMTIQQSEKNPEKNGY